MVGLLSPINGSKANHQPVSGWDQNRINTASQRGFLLVHVPDRPEMEFDNGGDCCVFIEKDDILDCAYSPGVCLFRLIGVIVGAGKIIDQVSNICICIVNDINSDSFK